MKKVPLGKINVVAGWSTPGAFGFDFTPAGVAWGAGSPQFLFERLADVSYNTLNWSSFLFEWKTSK